jgi:hypothetical protein
VQALWDRDDFPLSVCFQSASNSSAAERQTVRSTVEAAWPQHSEIVRFTGWDTCGPEGADIEILHSSTITRSCSTFGKYHETNSGGCDGIMKLRTPLSSPNTNLPYAYVHEFGHALGFRHEQSHPDHDTLDPTCTDDEALGDGTVLGPYDPDSIMNYCAPASPVLSAGDIESIQTMYPFHWVHDVVLVGAKAQRMCTLRDGYLETATQTTRLELSDGSVRNVSGHTIDASTVPAGPLEVECRSDDGVTIDRRAGRAVSLAAVMAGSLTPASGT